MKAMAFAADRTMDGQFLVWSGEEERGFQAPAYSQAGRDLFERQLCSEQRTSFPAPSRLIDDAEEIGQPGQHRTPTNVLPKKITNLAPRKKSTLEMVGSHERIGTWLPVGE